jgi:hypothetical protein
MSKSILQQMEKQDSNTPKVMETSFLQGLELRTNSPLEGVPPAPTPMPTYGLRSPEPLRLTCPEPTQAPFDLMMANHEATQAPHNLLTAVPDQPLTLPGLAPFPVPQPLESAGIGPYPASQSEPEALWNTINLTPPSYSQIMEQLGAPFYDANTGLYHYRPHHLVTSRSQYSVAEHRRNPSMSWTSGLVIPCLITV